MLRFTTAIIFFISIAATAVRSDDVTRFSDARGPFNDVMGMMRGAFPAEARIEKLLESRSDDLPEFPAWQGEVPAPGRNMGQFLDALEKSMQAILGDIAAHTDSTGEANDLVECIDDVTMVLNDSRHLDFSAMKMFDSWGTPESGILEGNVRWPGHYHECRSTVNYGKAGRWCNSHFGVRLQVYPANYPIDISLGSCFPSSCSEQSVRVILNVTYATTGLLDVTCPVHDKSLTTPDIIGIVVTSIFALLALIGTASELMFANREQKDDMKDKPKQPIAVKILICFSVIKNGKAILDMNQRPGTIQTLHGIRFISTTWVVLGHAYLFYVYGIDNAATAERTFKAFGSSMPIVNGFYSVDTFFLLSGILVAFLGTKHLRRSGGKINVPMMYLQRYLRLTPTYAYMILIVTGLFKFAGTGPFWPDIASFFNNSCKDGWWANLLYINNLYPLDPKCFNWGWYLANDTQFYIISPIFLIALYRSKVLGLVLSCLMLGGSMLTTAMLTYNYNLQPITIYEGIQISFFSRFLYYASTETTYTTKLQQDTYHAPWCRVSVYMVGIIVGYILHEHKKQISKMSKATALTGWLLSGVISCAIVYGLFPAWHDTALLSREMATFYETFARPVWGMCVAWVVVACSCGFGGPITKFLDWRVFIPLSRLTYSAYLVHILPLFWFLGSQEMPMHFLNINTVYYYLGSLLISFGLAFLLSLFIEWPLLGLLKFIKPSGQPRKEKEIEEKNEKMEEVFCENKSASNVGYVDDESSTSL